MELAANTPAGARLVELAEALATDFATRAAQHDREGSYPFASVRTLTAAGYLAAPVPAHLGGLGVETVHDVIVAAAAWRAATRRSRSGPTCTSRACS